MNTINEYWLDKYNFLIIFIMMIALGITATLMTLDVKYMWFSSISGIATMGIMIAIKTYGLKNDT